MGVSRGAESTIMSGRAQSTLIGIVLLLGMVAIGSLGIFLVASDMLTDVEQESEHDRVEQGFVELSQQMAAVATNDDVSRSMDLDTGESGAVVMTNTGNIHIHGGEVDDNISIGAIEYEGEDGTKIAYQAGGVFRETMNQTQVKSAPPVHYEDETLSFPVVEIDDQGNLGSGDVTLTKTDTKPVSSPSTIENDVITINVTSQYYLGWKQYFEEQAGNDGDPIQEYGELNETHGYVNVEFGTVDIEAVFENAVTVEQEPTRSSAGEIHGNVQHEGVHIDPIDDKIESLIDTAKTEYTPLNNSVDEITAGEYYVEDGFNTTDYDKIDVADGDIIIVVNDSINVNDQTSVEGWEEDKNEVQIYTNNNMNVNGELFVDESPHAHGMNAPDQEDVNSQHLQVYGNSSFEMILGSGGDFFEGLVYAPKGEIYTAGGSGDTNIYGSVVAGDVDLGSSGNSEIWHDNSLDGFEPETQNGGTLPPDITYLNVVKHILEIDS
ncbi:hypothetical protein [Natronorubrum sp. A-ect3]|uniref:DUF7289 family protein n=1 Tax=Natronorubrum sp. A-ect3 TaxID=3242698 RepID=UPI00359D26A2